MQMQGQRDARRTELQDWPAAVRNRAGALAGQEGGGSQQGGLGPLRPGAQQRQPLRSVWAGRRGR